MRNLYASYRADDFHQLTRQIGPILNPRYATSSILRMTTATSVSPEDRIALTSGISRTGDWAIYQTVLQLAARTPSNKQPLKILELAAGTGYGSYFQAGIPFPLIVLKAAFGSRIECTATDITDPRDLRIFSNSATKMLTSAHLRFADNQTPEAAQIVQELLNKSRYGLTEIARSELGSLELVELGSPEKGSVDTWRPSSICCNSKQWLHNVQCQQLFVDREMSWSRGKEFGISFVGGISLLEVHTQRIQDSYDLVVLRHYGHPPSQQSVSEKFANELPGWRQLLRSHGLILVTYDTPVSENQVTLLSKTLDRQPLVQRNEILEFFPKLVF